MSESLSEAVQKLWELDSNRCEPNQDYQLNVQEGKKPYVLTSVRCGCIAADSERIAGLLGLGSLPFAV